MGLIFDIPSIFLVTEFYGEPGVLIGTVLDDLVQSQKQYGDSRNQS